MRIAVLALLLLACDTESSELPDAGPAFCVYDESTECSEINSYPDCYRDECDAPICSRTCSTERLCQEWDDCELHGEGDAGVDGGVETGPCFQCRYQVTCWCG